MNRSPSRRTALTAAGAAALAASATGLVGAARGATPAAESDAVGDRVVLHPTLPSQVPTNNSFTVKVRPAGGTWQTLDVYRVRLALINPITARNEAPLSSMAAFDFSGTVEVEVTYNPGGFEKVRIRPDSYGITPEVLGSTAHFTLDRPRNLVIQVDDKIFDCLHLLANPIEQDPPVQDDPKVIYFGPGYHTRPDGYLTVPDGTTVYLAAGAVLTANVVFEGVESGRLTGRGVIYTRTGGAISVHDSQNVHVDGITVLNPRYNSITVAESENVTITNLRSFSADGWGDGIDIFCSENVTIDGCFLRNSDDCIAIYTHRWDYYGDTRNITVKNCTLWADVAHPINVGIHGNPDPNAHEVLENLRFENIDILDHREPQVNAQGCIALNPGDGNLIRDVRFDNIRVEDIRWGQLIQMRVAFDPRWNTAVARGVEGVYIKDLTYTGTHASTSLLIGHDADHGIKDITFENLVINGRVIRDSGGKPAWYLASDGVPMFANNHVHNLRFLTTEEAAAL
jgi:glycosyl hydrolase family 28